MGKGYLMTSNGDRFEGAYNKIDEFLRKKFGGAKMLSFSSIVVEAARKDATVRANKENLLQFGDLRNAIVHDRGKTPVVLADPRDDTVGQIEKIWDRISHPRLLRSLPRPVPLRIFVSSAALSEALSYMRENEFSQVIAFHEGKHLILSTVGIAHWLEAKSREDIISLSEARISDLLTFEPKGSCIYVRATDTADQARELFTTDIGRTIFSQLVTEHGSATEKPINIVTPWDFVAGVLL